MTNTAPWRRRIAVLGGGITGLATAYTLARARQAGAPIQEFLIEASERLGGLIRTEQVEGFVVEAGPDSFLAEKPEAAALCRELGFADSLLGSNDAQRRHYILHRGRLIVLPEGLQFFVPSRLWPVLRTPLLSLRGKLSIVSEWFASPPSKDFSGRGAHRGPLRVADEPDHGGHARHAGTGRPPLEDESVASFVRRHFGNTMFENIVDPLLAGIFGGDSSCLSVRSVVPRFLEMEQKYGSLTRGLHAVGAGLKPASTTAPLFMTLKGGLGLLVEELKKHLEDARVHLGQRVVAIQPAPDGSGEARALATLPPATGSIAPQYEIRCEVREAALSPRAISLGGTERRYNADAVILALPAYECSRLLAPFDSSLSQSLNAIPYTSALTVALGYDVAAARQLPSGFGLLVPRKEKRRLLACTFVHSKFSHRAPPGMALLRCFLGGFHDPDVLNLSDDEIVRIVRRELRTILNLSTEPLFHRVYHWPSSMPQYVVGHEERVNTIHQRLKGLPGLFLAGNAYSGIGISDCIRTGRAAAEGALQNLSQ